MLLFENTEVAFKLKSNYELRKAYALFKAVDQPWLTRILSKTMSYAMLVPGAQKIIKETVFAQFCGGESLQESLDTVDCLYSSNVKSILDYSVEGKEDEVEYERCFKEILKIIAIAKDNPKVPFVVFKPSGFGNINIYEKIGRGDELSDIEQNAWDNISRRFNEVAKEANASDVTLMIDAEESWMQTAVDNLVEVLMQKYNRQRCVIVNTLQMYRHDRLAYLKTQLNLAEEKDYKIGFKIVRGAYMEKERERAEAQHYASPIQPNKEATDQDYNKAIEFIIKNNNRISLFAGTHNEESCKLLMDSIEGLNLNRENSKVWFGQLLGMSDNISFVLSDLGYNVAKYVPYGPVKEVIPYLVRRAQENTSVAGQSSRELTLIQKELKRRKLK